MLIHLVDSLFYISLKSIYSSWYWFLSKLSVPTQVWTHLFASPSLISSFLNFWTCLSSLLSHAFFFIPSLIYLLCLLLLFLFPTFSIWLLSVFTLSSHPHTSSSPCRSPPYMPSRPAHGAVAVPALKRSTVRSDTSPSYRKPFLKTQRGSIWGKTQSLCINTHAHRSTETLLSMPAQGEEN